MKFVSWNQEAWKTGICAVPPVGYANGLLTLSNNTCSGDLFEIMHQRFMRLYRRKVRLYSMRLIIKANLHHYTDYMDVDGFNQASENVKSIIGEYGALY